MRRKAWITASAIVSVLAVITMIAVTLHSQRPLAFLDGYPVRRRSQALDPRTGRRILIYEVALERGDEAFRRPADDMRCEDSARFDDRTHRSGDRRIGPSYL